MLSDLILVEFLSRVCGTLVILSDDTRVSNERELLVCGFYVQNESTSRLKRAK